MTFLPAHVWSLSRSDVWTSEVLRLLLETQNSPKPPVLKYPVEQDTGVMHTYCF